MVNFDGPPFAAAPCAATDFRYATLANGTGGLTVTIGVGALAGTCADYMAETYRGRQFEMVFSSERWDFGYVHVDIRHDSPVETYAYTANFSSGPGDIGFPTGEVWWEDFPVTFDVPGNTMTFTLNASLVKMPVFNVRFVSATDNCARNTCVGYLTPTWGDRMPDSGHVIFHG